MSNYLYETNQYEISAKIKELKSFLKEYKFWKKEISTINSKFSILSLLIFLLKTLHSKDTSLYGRKGQLMERVLAKNFFTLMGFPFL